MAELLMKRKNTRPSTIKKMERLYKEGKSPYAIAKETGLSPTTIRYHLKKENVPMRDLKAAAEAKIKIEPAVIVKEYESGKSAYDISLESEIPVSTIYYYLRKAGAKIRTISETVRGKQKETK